METVAVNFHDDTGEIFSEFKLQVSCFCIGTPGRCEGRSEERLYKPLLICKPTTIFLGEKFSFSYTYYHTLIVLIHERSLTGRCSGNELASTPLPPLLPLLSLSTKPLFLTFLKILRFTFTGRRRRGRSAVAESQWQYSSFCKSRVYTGKSRQN